MSEIFLMVFFLSVAASLVFLLLTAVSKICGRFFRVNWHFYTCMFLCLCMLLPLVTHKLCSGDKLTVFYPATEKIRIQESASEKKGIDTENTADTKKDAYAAFPAAETDNTKRISGEKTEDKQKKASYTKGKEDRKKITAPETIPYFEKMVPIFSWIWLAGMLFYFLLLICSGQRFLSRIRRWKAKPSALSQEVFSELIQKQGGFKRKIQLYSCEAVSSPILAGFWHSMVILPDREYTRKEYQLLLSHELCHYRHGDLCWKRMLALVQGIYWFAPAVHAMVQACNNDMEIMCDREVLRQNPYMGRKEYGMLLLKHMAKKNACHSSLSTSFYGGKKQMKDRFRRLKEEKGKKGGLALLLCFVIIIAITGNTALSIANEVKKEMNKQDSTATEKEGLPNVSLNSETTDTGSETSGTDWANAAEITDEKNYLIIGLDYVNKDTPQMADMIVLVNLDPKTASISFTDIPRELLINQPQKSNKGIQGSYTKLSGLYAVDGAEGMEKALEKILDIKIDGSVSLSYDGFREIIDAMGGVELKVSKREASYLNKHNFIFQAENRCLKAGKQLLNGDQALGYARVRKIPADSGEKDVFGRGDRAMKLLNAAYSQVAASKEKLPKLLSLALKNVDTTLSAKDIYSAAKTVCDGNYQLSERLQVSYSIPDAYLYEADEHGVSGLNFEAAIP